MNAIEHLIEFEKLVAGSRFGDFDEITALESANHAHLVEEAAAELASLREKLRLQGEALEASKKAVRPFAGLYKFALGKGSAEWNEGRSLGDFLKDCSDALALIENVL